RQLPDPFALDGHRAPRAGAGGGVGADRAPGDRQQAHRRRPARRARAAAGRRARPGAAQREGDPRVIRVNLLPQKRRKAAAARGDMWLLGSLVLVALQVVACFVWYGSKQDQLAQQQSKNSALEAQIKQIKDVSKNHDDLKKRLAILREREEAIAKLQSARTGPTAM